MVFSSTWIPIFSLLKLTWMAKASAWALLQTWVISSFSSLSFSSAWTFSVWYRWPSLSILTCVNLNILQRFFIRAVAFNHLLFLKPLEEVREILFHVVQVCSKLAFFFQNPLDFGFGKFCFGASTITGTASPQTHPCSSPPLGVLCRAPHRCSSPTVSPSVSFRCRVQVLLVVLQHVHAGTTDTTDLPA